jgi:hypothetical protein
MEPDEDPIDVVQSVGDLDQVVVTLREFLHRSGATRVCAVLEEGPSLVDVGRLLPVEVTVGERVVQLPHALQLDADALPLPDVKQLPAFEVVPDEGEVRSPLGGLEHYALAVLGLAATLGGRSVALATFDTTTPDAPLSITARQGDPVVLSIGEDEYEMEPGWPAPSAPVRG